MRGGTGNVAGGGVGGGGVGRGSGYSSSSRASAPASAASYSRLSLSRASASTSVSLSQQGGGGTTSTSAGRASGGSSSLVRASGGASASASSGRASLGGGVTSSRPGAVAVGEAVPWGRSAAASHLANDQYMGDWDKAYQELYGESSVPKEGPTPQPILSMAPAHALAKFSERRPRSLEVGGATTIREAAGGGSSSSSSSLSASVLSSTIVTSAPSGTLLLGQPGEAVVQGGTYLPPCHPALTPQWLKAPLNPSGALIDLSDRPLMAAAISPRACATSAQAALAGTDHAVYTVDLLRGARSRTLHGGRYGHREWVTGVCYLGDSSDRIASCGMDGKVCLWEAGAGGSGGGGSGKGGPPARCLDYTGHFGSVSAVASPGGGTPAGGPPSALAGHCLLSAGYDKSVRVWDTRRSATGSGSSGSSGGSGGGLQAAQVFSGHAAPVLCLAVRARDAVGSVLCASGDRGGVVRLWDLAAGGSSASSSSSSSSCVGVMGGHGGHITSMAWLCGGAEGGGGDLLLTGAQDGKLRVWDPRGQGVGGGALLCATVPAHVAAGGGGSGAVGDIAVARCGGSVGALGYARGAHEAGGLEEGGGDALVVTAGADRRLCVTDPRGGWRVRHELSGHSDFIYSLACVGGLALSGGGDGLLLAHNVASGEVLWGLGANEAAVRCIGVCATGPRSRQVMLAAGDDGKCLVYDF